MIQNVLIIDLLTPSDKKVNFSQIYSHDEDILKNIIPMIEQLWNTRTGHGSMITG